MESCDLIERLPDPQEIRERLEDLEAERRLLRQLLKLMTSEGERLPPNRTTPQGR